MDDIPSAFNLFPLLSGGKANRRTPIGRFEVPQRMWRPLIIGALGGMVAWVIDMLFGAALTDWRFLAVGAIAGGLVWWRWRDRPSARTVKFRVLAVGAVWLLFPIAQIVETLLGFAPVVGTMLGALTWPILGAFGMVMSTEARAKSGQTRIDSWVAEGRSGMLSGQLHLGLWPVPEVDTDIRWCDGAVPNPRRAPRR